MNYTLQLHGERMLYPTPPGLYEMMSDITREVLRDQPSQVYEYIAHYLDTLLRVRELSRVGEEVISDVIAENKELTSYVRSLGVSWEEANKAASRLQQAFRTYLCRKQLKIKIKQRQRHTLGGRSFSSSFHEYLDSLGVDIEEAERATLVIQTAYKAYKTRTSGTQESKRSSKHASTHTVEELKLKQLLTKKPFKRDSKLLVYQQTPRHSEESTWSTLRRDSIIAARKLKAESVDAKSSVGKQDKEEISLKAKAKPFRLVYQGVSEGSLTSKKQIDSSLLPETMRLPSYFNEDDQKIPMISKSGLLLEEDSDDAITLCSTDSPRRDEKKRSSGSEIYYPNVQNVSLRSNNEKMAKELFEIIGVSSPKSPGSTLLADVRSSEKKSEDANSILRKDSRITKKSRVSVKIAADTRSKVGSERVESVDSQQIQNIDDEEGNN